MRPTTRIRILDYLHKQQGASVDELSLSLGMTGANIRHHLAILESNGLVEAISERREGRGRPEHIYGLSRRVLGDGLETLARALLDVYVKRGADNAQPAGLDSLASAILNGDNVPPNDPILTRRLTKTIDRLNALRYQARWEAGADGPHIILGRCPYSAIIVEHPELCQMDAALLVQQTGLQAEQTAKLQPSTRGYPYCIFKLLIKK